MLKVFCFGNEWVEGDSLAKELADELEIDGVKFIKCDDVEDVEDGVILDVVRGLDDVQVVTELDRFKSLQPCSAHDLDLAFFLKLLKEMGHLNEVKIICLPMGMEKERAKKELRRLLPDNI